jgi:hypothetical protein
MSRVFTVTGGPESDTTGLPADRISTVSLAPGNALVDQLSAVVHAPSFASPSQKTAPVAMLSTVTDRLFAVSDTETPAGCASMFAKVPEESLNERNSKVLPTAARNHLQN